MTLQQLIDSGIKEVFIKSYGYTSVSALNSTWQPFKNARFIEFYIDEDNFLYNPEFWIEELSLEDEFVLKNGKYFSIMDFDLCSKD